MNDYINLIIFSVLIICSHGFEWLSRRLHVPSVLLLIVAGLLMRVAAEHTGIAITNLDSSVVFFGVIGLILIVLEGTLDLTIERKNAPVIGKAFFSAMVILAVSACLIAWFFKSCFSINFKSAMVNAIPFAVISSAVAIPAVAGLSHQKKEFIIYESVFSDILGIMFFNALIQPAAFVFRNPILAVANLIFIVILALVCSIALFFTLAKVKIRAKFIFMLAILVLLYAAGKIFHLPALLLILVFGVLLNNYKVFSHTAIFRLLNFQDLDEELKQFKSMVEEFAFLLRTVFFIIFGYSINIGMVLKPAIIIIGLVVILIIVLVRLLYLKFMRLEIIPEIFIMPRGLITVLLFYSIPAGYLVPLLERGVVFFIIIATGLLMMAGIFLSRFTRRQDISIMPPEYRQEWGK